MLALASVGGVWLVSVALLIANVGLMLLLGAFRPALLAPRRRPETLPGRRGTRPAPAARRPGGAAAPPRRARGRRGVAAFAVAAGSGPLAFALTPPFPAARQVTVALVQPGVVERPRAADRRERDADQPSSAPASALDEGAPRPHRLGRVERRRRPGAPTDRAAAAASRSCPPRTRREILVNQDTTIPGPNGGQEKSAVLVSPQGIQGTYVKTRLVPFGEYIPFRQQLGWLTKISKAASSNMIPGTGAHTLTVTSPTGRAKPLDVGVLICFESAFPDMSRVETDQGAQLIVYQSAPRRSRAPGGPTSTPASPRSAPRKRAGRSCRPR